MACVSPEETRGSGCFLTHALGRGKAQKNCHALWSGAPSHPPKPIHPSHAGGHCVGLSHETSGRAAKDDSVSHTQPGTKKPPASAVCKPPKGRACAFLPLNLLQFPGNSSGQARRALHSVILFI